MPRAARAKVLTSADGLFVSRENLVVSAGSLVLHVGSERFELGTGDAAYFEADAPHEYRNLTEVVLHLVMTTAERCDGSAGGR